MSSYYETFKALHIISIICWMAGLLYLPRLFVYHVNAKKNSELDKTLQLMENRLLRIIMNPAMISSILFGSLNAYIYGFSALGYWFHLKMLFVVILAAYHGFLSRCRKNFVKGENKYSEKFYRIINEIPSLLMVLIVFLVVLKPFD